MALASIYQRWIVDTGKQPELFLLLSFLASFGFIRTSAHMIRAQVSWWPGNVSVGGTHVHHLVWPGYLRLLPRPNPRETGWARGWVQLWRRGSRSRNEMRAS
jgi:hypothetical protein